MKNKIEYYKTVLTIVIGLIVLFFIFNTNIYFLYISLSIGLLALTSKSISYYIHIGWMGLATAMSYIMPNVLLSLLYFLILTPIALLQKIFSKNKTLQLKKPKYTSFSDNNKIVNKSDFLKPW